MNSSFNGNGTSPFLLQVEGTVDWLHQNFTGVPPIEDQSCNHTNLNETSASSPEWEGPTGMAWKWLVGKPHIAAKIILSVAYAVIIMISLFGNSLVCQVFIKHKEINKSTGLLIFNLAISDILIILLNSPFALVILHPTKPRLTHSQSILTVVVIWSLAVFLALPHAIYQNLFYVIIVRSHCLPAFPGPSKLVGKYVDLGTFGLLYILPLLVIVITYSHLGKRLWIQNSVGDASARQLMAHYQKRKKSIRMLILIVMVFAICWFPLNCYVVLISSAGIETESVLFYAFHWFAMSSTCYNPFIYCWLNRSFRAKLRSIASWCTKFLLCRSSQVQQQVQVQESHELQELQASALPQVPVAIPEPQVFEDPCLATGEGNSQISAQRDWENPKVSVSRVEQSSTLRPFFCIRVHSVKI
uniref:G-protein coupled receptors family 1 profile domain-containing protein n=1 Tax=Sciurus vulgaris TaxID=55149 RepID=A0A8D2DH94_SCIVU